MGGTAHCSLSLRLADDSATDMAGNDIAVALSPPCTIHLTGDLGAGKTALARAIIRHLTGDQEAEVPSPTFSLVQHYDATAKGKQVEIVHADLYRIGDAAEVVELGLADVSSRRIVLIEWPEKGADELPAPDLVLSILPVANEDGPESRMLTIEGSAETVARLGRSFTIRDFLDDVWPAGAERSYLLGDASTRSYEKAVLHGETRIVMNAPRQPDGPPIRGGKPYSQIAHLAEDVSAFVGVAQILQQAGLKVPRIHGANLEDGLLLISDLGSNTVLDEAGRPILERYLAAAQMLAYLHETPVIREAEVQPGRHHLVPDYDRDAMMIEVELLLDWYLPSIQGHAPDAKLRDEFTAHWDELIRHLNGGEKHLVLRDFHSPNILWQASEEGPKRVGLIDFQDAMIGPCAYDVASLAQDARVDVSAELEAHIIDAYIGERAKSGTFDEVGFRQDYAIMAAQRATKIMGIFVRLDQRDGKPDYLKHLPRMKAYLARSLTHPVLHAYGKWLASQLSETRSRSEGQ